MGGIGKTRLAIEFAFRQRSLFPGGIFFVSLASLNSPDLIISTIAEVLGLTFSGPANPKEQLLNYMANRMKQPSLLVFDNLEHLLAPYPQGSAGSGVIDLVVEALQRLPNLKILATSREQLNLQGEWMYELHGLPTPPKDFTGRLEDYEAVTLFILSARRVQADFEIQKDEHPALIRICRLLEGIPLAIELSAAWVRLLSCEEIVHEIESNLDFLTTSVHDIPERHRSIRATIDHSWKLLSDEECSILRRLAVFHGGFSRHAAERVAGASLSSLASLHAKSLVFRTEGERFDLHDLLRKYTLMKLEESQEELEHTKDIHCAYYLDFLGDREGDLRNERQLIAMAEISAESENIRAAWHHAVIHNQVAKLRKPILTFWFYDIRGLFQEAYALFRWTIEMFDTKNEPVQKVDLETIVTGEHIRASLAWFCVRLGKFDESRKLLHHSLPLLRSYGPCTELLNALHHMGALERLAGNFVLSQELFLEMLDVATGMGARWYIALAHGNVGVARIALGDYREGHTRLHIANTIFREVGDQRIMAVGLQFFGEALRNLEEYAEAQVCLYESLEISRMFGDRWISGLSLNQLGLVFRAKGEYEEASRLFRESLALLREIEEFWGMLQALNNLGSVCLTLGAYPEARSAFCESLSIAAHEKILPEALDALIGMAYIFMEEGDLEEALAMVLLALNHPLTRIESKARAEGICTKLTTVLSPQQVEAAHTWKNGKALHKVISEIVQTGRIYIRLA
jgi:predicted ATPase